MGRFKLGSTVINLFAKDAIKFDETMQNGEKTVLGTPFAHIAGKNAEVSEDAAETVENTDQA